MDYLTKLKVPLIRGINPINLPTPAINGEVMYNWQLLDIM